MKVLVLFLITAVSLSSFSQNQLDSTQNKILLEYLKEFYQMEKAVVETMEMELRHRHFPFSLGEEFILPGEMTIYKEDCPIEIILDDDNFITLPKGTVMKVMGTEVSNDVTVFLLGVDVDKNRINTYVSQESLDDFIFPGNRRLRESFYVKRERREKRLKDKFRKEYKISEEQLEFILNTLPPSGYDYRFDRD